MSVGSFTLKTSLLYYYRFKRGYSVVDECYSNFGEIADVLVDTKKHHYEIEIKITKSDIRAEKKKAKHKDYEEGYKLKQKLMGANKFYLCVPSELIPYAEKWIQEVNPKYGLIEFNTERFDSDRNKNRAYYWNEYIHIRKNASMLHNNYNKHLTRNMIKRLSSALCNAYMSQISRIHQIERDKNE